MARASTKENKNNKSGYGNGSHKTEYWRKHRRNHGKFIGGYGKNGAYYYGTAEA